MATLPIIRGDYEVIEFTITEPDPDNPGDMRVRDITNDTFTFSAKRTYADATPFMVKSTESGAGITKTAPVQGKGQIEILPDDTDNITQKTRLYCDIEGVAPPNRPYTSLFEISVVLDVSN